jgi:RNA polymerase sigma factor (sigma-70 family)
VEPPENLPDRLPQPEEALVGQEELAETLAALDRLEERERELLALKFSARMTNRQISALTGLSESNVGVILYRAIQRMRAMIMTNIGEVTRE